MLSPVAKVPFLRTLTLQGFRSVAAERIEFDNPLFLVGRNNSGKSSLADAISFLAEAATSPLESVIRRRGGISVVFHDETGQPSAPRTCGLSVEVAWEEGDLASAEYGFELQASSERSYEVVAEHGSLRDRQGTGQTFRRLGRSETLDTNIAGFYPLLSPSSLVLPIAAGLRAVSPLTKALSAMTVYSIDPAKLRAWHRVDPGLALRPDGGNAASVLRRMLTESERTVLRIDELLSSVTPQEIAIRPIGHGSQIGLELTQTWDGGKSVTLDSACLSDGTLRALGLLIAVFQEPVPPVLVIEEPEATMHPEALGLVSDLLRHAATRSQVIVTTHSPDLLDAKWIEDRHLRIVHWHDGATRVSPIAAGARQALQDHLMGAGELLRSRALDAPPLSQGEREPAPFERTR